MGVNYATALWYGGKDTFDESEEVAEAGGGFWAEGFSAFGAVDRSGEDGGVVFNVRGLEGVSTVRAGGFDESS